MAAIEWDNIRDDKDSQFKSYAKTGKGEDVGPYGFDSIMHYKPQAFGI